MHIALTAPFWGQPTTGSGQYLHRLVEELRQQDSSLRLTLIADADAARRAPPPEGVSWHVARTPLDDRSPNLAKLWFEQVAAPRAARAVGADLLHVPYFAPPLSHTMPLVVTIHDLIPMLLPAYRGSALVRGYTALAARAARRADVILADSHASHRDILRHLRVEPARVYTVYLAADECFAPQSAEAIAAVRRKYALPEHFALYLGGFDVRKNVPRLLKALAQSDGEWPLVLAGKLPGQDSAFFPDPRRLVAQWGLDERVIFTGWIEEEEKPALLAAADLFVFPSAYEGFGLPILEAMACGTATLTTNVSSLPELAGDAAALVPPNDVPALAQAMTHLMRDEAARRELAAHGPGQAARFSWARCAAETLESYGRAFSSSKFSSSSSRPPESS
ncbi:MAG: glycosyltransferase family 4 protein [Ardenticatenales bacterium]|nr:glycosyltransferase family 4 protein [Ardenticatenales bacterium]